MSAQNKQRNQKIVSELASLPGNNICADCKARLPRWASYSLGIFICTSCASIHRKIGTHITKVKSLTLDDWTKEQVETMKSMGNVKSNAIYNPNEFRNPPPPNLEDSERDSEIEQYIRAKYEYKKFLDKSALVASKLGPSRSATLPPPRSAPSFQPAPLSQPAPLPQSSAHVAKSYVASATSHMAPPRPPQALPIAQPPQPTGDTWNDINSLNNSQNSSLPLQYQQSTYSHDSLSTQVPAVSSGMGANSYGYPVGVTVSSVGLNPYQRGQIGTNPFSRPPLAAPPVTSPFSAPTMSSQPFGEHLRSPPSQPSAPSVHHSVAPPAYFHQQSQTSMQIQNPSDQNFMSPSQPFPSAPAGLPQFPSQNYSSIQRQYVSHNPQQMQSSSSPQVIYPSPASTEPQIGGHNVPPGQSQFLGMTTMQMQQQAFQQHHQQQQQLQQQQIQQQQHHQMQQQHQQQGQGYYSSMQPQMSTQVNGVYGQSSTYHHGGFPSQTGGQWGTK